MNDTFLSAVVLLLLVAEESRFINGAVITADDGLSVS